MNRFVFDDGRLVETKPQKGFCGPMQPQAISARREPHEQLRFDEAMKVHRQIEVFRADLPDQSGHCSPRGKPPAISHCEPVHSDDLVDIGAESGHRGVTIIG